MGNRDRVGKRRRSGNGCSPRLGLVALAHLCVSFCLSAVMLQLQSDSASETALNSAARAREHLAVRAELSERYLTAATTFDGSRGEGHTGMLYLLAAYDLDPTNEVALEALVQNYVRQNYPELALDEIQNVLRVRPGFAKGTELMEWVKKERPDAWDRWRGAVEERGSAVSELAPPRETLAFGTLVSRFDVAAQFPDRVAELHREFYVAAVQLRDSVLNEATSALSPTELNHALFTRQMEHLRSTGDCYFVGTALYGALMGWMREAAERVLVMHGFDAEVAARKAAHELIFWVSVHDGKSVHEPHVTEDALLGGVYYVAVPEGSGSLGLFDPRGKSPMLAPLYHDIERDGQPTSRNGAGPSLPTPPFHKTVEVQPKEGLLVLFPGWLVHTVRPSHGLQADSSGYRVSISVNLKGEWQDTADLVLDVNEQNTDVSSFASSDDL